MGSDTGKIDKFLEDNYPLIRLLTVVLGVVLIAVCPVAWDLVGWGVGAVLLTTGAQLVALAVRGGK